MTRIVGSNDISDFDASCLLLLQAIEPNFPEVPKLPYLNDTYGYEAPL